MIDAEKVDKGLEACTGNGTCKACPYFPYGGDCVNALMKDAAELICKLKDDAARPAAKEV